MKRTGFTSKPNAMRQVSAKRTAKRASAQGQADLAYMGQVRSLPCIICDTYGLTQTSKVEAHHWIMDRGGTRKTPDDQTIPLCLGHHKGDFDTSKIAIHRAPKAWREAYGPDHGYIEATQRMVRNIVGGSND